ncbi:Brix-domain-containing protein [Tilletiaria anomala UBC 951]|uniref:Brix-domain-containing protein n=1 Tax=Tilletiaria anomala (strain ATCC 24038 / CBS 436.72 / UBC 951) TaxID=1037660 RepID=A0A066VIU4_TILAU|nr:Brix-domain-containing protein [Tilletiaria anomala UBC 951]KDN38505.1 Brix-domain-containing protein [Tilletiaria anomala UBC 951]
MATRLAAAAQATSSKGKRKLREEDEEIAASTTPALRKNRQRVLVLPSRGVTSQMRHLINDIESLLPHSKKDSKLDSKSNLHILNELAELNNCNNTLYFEARKHTDLYLWMSKTPNGPSVKLQVQNIHTMDELKMTGNCLKGSRHVVSFDKGFDLAPHTMLMKELLTQIFAVPRTSRRTKPFVDHVLSFSYLDGKIWFRNFQITESLAHESASELAAAALENAKDRASKSKKGKDQNAKPPTLIEIGPRFVMVPIKIFEGSFGGATLFDNPEYVSPNAVRHAMRRKKGEKFTDKVKQQNALEEKRAALQLPEDELSNRKVFG